MLKKMPLATLGCLFAVTATAGACHGKACHYTLFDTDKAGCLEIRNSGREDIEVTVYTTGSIPIRVSIASGSTETVFKAGRTCLPAADYVRAESEFVGGAFEPRN